MNSKLFIVATAAAVVEAKWQCNINNYEDYIPSFAAGFQKDPTATDTDCYASS